MSSIQFCKMHGLGNDFMVIDGISQQIDFAALPIQQLSNRYLGVGFDQLLLITPSKNADFACKIYNCDGTEAEQCGNGMRCVARFVHEEKLTEKNSLSVETKAGIIQAFIHNYDRIDVNMGFPGLHRVQKLENETVDFSVLSMGNPHAVLHISSIEQYPVEKIAAKIAAHSLFPEGVNVGFFEIVSRNEIRLRTIERGVGETFACGSNACAAVVSGILNGQLDSPVNVQLTFGHLSVEWLGEKNPVILSGPAARSFSGRWDNNYFKK